MKIASVFYSHYFAQVFIYLPKFVNFKNMQNNLFHIGSILKSIREDRAYQLLDVQNITGIDSSLLSRIENGKRLPTIEQLNLLSDMYKIDNKLLFIQRESDKIISSFADSSICIESLDTAKEKMMLGQQYLTLFKETYLSDPIALSSRRYIGSKTKLLDWIFGIIADNTTDIHTFCDIFSGTGVVAERALRHYDKVIVNDLLYSNNIIYKAFFEKGAWDKEKLCEIITGYNSLNSSDLEDNYFSKNFGGKFFEYSESKKIGYIRQDIEDRKADLTEKEYDILLATLIYNIDKIANTLGHYEAYIRKPIQHKPLFLKLIDAKSYDNIEIYREDSNLLARKIKSDIVYIDPPYNSRQYSRFYHLYETLVKWDMPELHGVAMKPAPENMSKYCSNGAARAMEDLVTHLDTKYIAVSYNNTYNSKSSSSENKIQLEELAQILNGIGQTRQFEQNYRAFNAGKTDLKDHKEFLFITKVK